ncbi:hypothetical protein cand_023040 [Cryptosporidium andersoni]|uniref:AN1-type domain-containing protein n=1 Tax=Cryptosporidium andersoni TaxID=117008 RepID=A0A1J4MRT9_9CRYT|nr:hypothetical protein cand_023040 [Cryptosporidium andersoni]
MTELEEIGCNCNYKECKALDFLPFLCSGCNLKFCINHRNPHDHKCKDGSNSKVYKKDIKLSQKIEDDIKSLQPLRCHVKGCGKLGINCNKSNLTVCSYHRSLTSSSIQDIPTRVSSFTNKHRIIKGINLPTSNGKTSELIRRIKIKGNSIGDISIYQSSRLPVALIIKANAVFNN